jgi:hypothetical protein
MFGDVRLVHVNPSGEVITDEVPPSADTAANNPNCGDQHTDCHEFIDAAVRLVHVIPFGDVII